MTRRRPALRLTDAVGVFAVAFTAAAALALGLPAAPAWAHSGDGLAQPVVDQVSPLPPGITVQVAYSVNYELLVGDRTAQAITFLADSGEPFLRIGPAGVEGNFASPTFFDSNVPSGRDTYPPDAKPGPDVPPIWRKLSRQPNWGWYDHRLHPTESYLPPEVTRATAPVVLGRWKVPIKVGDQAGEIQGRFEYRPPTGSYGMVQKSSQTPADGLTIQVVSGSIVPAVFVKNESTAPVVVLGKDGEPFARIGPQVSEVNLRSPTWAEIEQANGKDPSDEADPKAEPRWLQVSDGPSWQWLELRAAAPKTDPPAAVIAQGKPVTVKNWSIPYLIGDRRQTIDGITEFTPIAALRAQAAGDSKGGGSVVPLYLGAGLAAAVLVAGGWLVTSKVRDRRSA